MKYRFIHPAGRLDGRNVTEPKQDRYVGGDPAMEPTMEKPETVRGLRRLVKFKIVGPLLIQADIIGGCLLPAHPRTSVPRTRSYNEEEHGKPLRAILGVDRRCYRRPTACSPTCPHPPSSLSLFFSAGCLSFDIPLTFSIPLPDVRRAREEARSSFSLPVTFPPIFSLAPPSTSFLSALSLDIYADIPIQPPSRWPSDSQEIAARYSRTGDSAPGSLHREIHARIYRLRQKTFISTLSLCAFMSRIF